MSSISRKIFEQEVINQIDAAVRQGVEPRVLCLGLMNVLAHLERVMALRAESERKVAEGGAL